MGLYTVSQSGRSCQLYCVGVSQVLRIDTLKKAVVSSVNLVLIVMLSSCAAGDGGGLFRSTVRLEEVEASQEALAGEVLPDPDSKTTAKGHGGPAAGASVQDGASLPDGTAEAMGEEPVAREAASAESGGQSGRRGEPFIAPVPFRSPSLGWGGSLAGGYIFRLDPEDAKSPPSTIGGGVFGTENESYGGVVSMKGHLLEDLWRFTVTTFVARVEYDYFGIGSDAGEEGVSIELRSDMYVVKLDLLRNLPTEGLGRFGKRLYFGPVFESSINRTRERSGLLTGSANEDLDEDQIGLGAKILRDTRDNNFYPLEGSLAELTFKAFDDAFGGDDDYRLIDLSLKGYRSLTPETVAAWRLVGKLGEADVPFTALPQHDFRGYERGRYRDKVHVGGELELRQEIWGRLGGAAFVGLGQIASSIDDLDTDRVLWSAGFGLRLRLTEENRLNYRSDVAWGRNGFEFYFSISEAF